MIGDETNGYRFDIFQYYGRIGLYVGNFFNEKDITEPTIIDFQFFFDILEGNISGLSRADLPPEANPNFRVRVYNPSDQKRYQLIYSSTMSNLSTAELIEIRYLTEKENLSLPRKHQENLAQILKQPFYIDPLATFNYLLQKADLSPEEMRTNPFVEVKAVLI